MLMCSVQRTDVAMEGEMQNRTKRHIKDSVGILGSSKALNCIFRVGENCLYHVCLIEE